MTEAQATKPYAGPDGPIIALQQLQARLSGGVLSISGHPHGSGPAWDAQFLDELAAVLQALAHDPAVRLLLLRAGQPGGGPDAFTGGGSGSADASTAASTAAADASAAAADARQLVQVQRRLRLLPQPVIAAVQGHCAGRISGLLEACDIVLASDDASFVLTPADGVLPGPLGKSISRVMTPRAARCFALTGRAFDGREAERCGLVTRSLPAADLEAEIATLIGELLAKDALALQFTKETLQHVGAMDWDAVLNFNAAKFAELKALQAGRPSARAAAVESFLAGKSKPGLGG